MKKTFLFATVFVVLMQPLCTCCLLLYSVLLAIWFPYVGLILNLSLWMLWAYLSIIEKVK